MLERRCDECGFDGRTLAATDVATMLRANARRWVELLSEPDTGGSREWVRNRPAPLVWSALEYACHVRDVFRLYLFRLELMLNEDGPHFPNWDQDATAIEDRYDLADPAAVANEIMDAAEPLAARLEAVPSGSWTRTGSRSDGVSFTIDTFARYFIHDPVHHLHDVEDASRRGRR